MCVSKALLGDQATLGGRSGAQGGKKRESHREGEILEGVDQMSMITAHASGSLSCSQLLLTENLPGPGPARDEGHSSEQGLQGFRSVSGHC